MASRILLFLLCAFSCTVVYANSHINPLHVKNTLYRSMTVELHNPAHINYSLSAECDAEINHLINGDPKNLAADLIMALDAFGKPPAGLLELNLAWLGHYDECMAIDGFNYCLTYLNFNATFLEDIPFLRPFWVKFGKALNLDKLPIKWGICVPRNCSENDVNAVMKYLLDSPNMLGGILPSNTLTETASVCTKKPPIPYSAGFICTVILCCFIASLMLMGALYDEYLKLQTKMTRSRLTLFAEIASPWRVLNDTSEADGNDDDVPLIRDAGNGKSINEESGPPKKHSLPAKLLLCFALNRNMAKLMDVRQSDSSVGSLNGIRVISMSWVILGHTIVFVFTLAVTDNTFTLLHFLTSQPSFQAVVNAFFSVDSFFFLSGFLVAYLSFGRFGELRNVKSWALFYFHRYWRLTPLYAFTILVYLYIPQFFGDGPLWQSFVARPSCPKYWWSNLLYINNFWPEKMMDQCIGWSWYLANDMQFFIISPLFMAPLFYFPIFGWFALILTLLASFVTTGLIIGIYGLNVSLAGIFQATSGADFSSLVYEKPYCRIAPYLVGIGLGYIMYKIGKRKVKMSPILALVGWLVAGALACTVVYGLYPSTKTPLSEAGNIAYGTTSRFAWSLSLAWVVFACKYGYGGWINSFLSWRAWIPLARVTYSAYLFHPFVILVFYENFANPWHFSPYLLAFYFAGLVSISYFVAIFVALAIEYPFANLEKILLPTRSQKSKKAEACPPLSSATDVVTVITPSEGGMVFRGSHSNEEIPTECNHAVNRK